MSNHPVVTRFPPSPTGFLHIGGARTALFNWLYARQHQGTFILRIEDTDTERSSEEATRAILESLEWLGLDWDQGPFFQSRRTELYETYIQRLLDAGMAYHCHCTREELDRKREQARAIGLKPKYDGTCRNLGLGPAPGSVVRLKSPTSGRTVFQDAVKGSIAVDNEELDDLILKRSDGSPTYHLAVVVDDISLGVNTVIRGDDHVNNTPRQIMIYQALGEPLPLYAHVPMILGPDRTRLSKRHGATSVLAYRDMGYLPQALLNALARLGWSYGDQEKFSLAELTEKFSLDRVGKSAGVFNAEKLLDLNAWYIRETDSEELARLLVPFLEELDLSGLGRDRVVRAVDTLKERSRTLREMAEAAAFYFQKTIHYEDKGDRKFLKPSVLDHLKALRGRLAHCGEFHEKALESVFSAYLEENSIKLGKVAQPLRVALTGKTASPGLFEVMDVLGRDEVLRRIDAAVAHIQAKSSQGPGA